MEFGANSDSIVAIKVEPVEYGGQDEEKGWIVNPHIEEEDYVKPSKEGDINSSNFVAENENIVEPDDDNGWIPLDEEAVLHQEKAVKAKRKIGEQERERRRLSAIEYRAKKCQDHEWKAKESKRTLEYYTPKELKSDKTLIEYNSHARNRMSRKRASIYTDTPPLKKKVCTVADATVDYEPGTNVVVADANFSQEMDAVTDAELREETIIIKVEGDCEQSKNLSREIDEESSQGSPEESRDETVDLRGGSYYLQAHGASRMETEEVEDQTSIVDTAETERSQGSPGVSHDETVDLHGGSYYLQAHGASRMGTEEAEDQTSIVDTAETERSQGSPEESHTKLVDLHGGSYCSHGTAMMGTEEVHDQSSNGLAFEIMTDPALIPDMTSEQGNVHGFCKDFFNSNCTTVDKEMQSVAGDGLCRVVSNVKGSQDTGTTEEIQTVAEIVSHRTPTKSGDVGPGEMDSELLQQSPDSVIKQDRTNTFCNSHPSRFQDQDKSVQSNQTQYQCKFCYELFFEAITLGLHEKSHTGEIPLFCERAQCDRVTCLLNHLEDYNIIDNGGKRRYCKYCDKSFLSTRRGDLRRHERIHSGDKPYHCKYCEESFLRLSGLKTHQNKMHKSKCPHKCQLCMKSFADLDMLYAHERKHAGEEKPYHCNICGKSFSHEGNYNNHNLAHINGKSPQSKPNKNSCFGDGHVKKCVKAGVMQTMPKCKYCDREFDNIDDVQNHEKLHVIKRAYECKYCDESFFHVDKFKEHQIMHTSEKQFKCRYCGKAFYQLGILTNHELIHTSEKSFRCKKCSKGFLHASDMRRHEKIHETDRMFHCKFCNKAFLEVAGLKKHGQIHAHEKSYECVHCGKTFHQASALKKHNKIHTTEKKHKCQYCDKAFLQRSDMTRHERTHTSDKKPFPCGQCKKTFMQSSYLKRHERVHSQDHAIS